MDGQFSIVVLENLRNQSINRYYFSIYFHKIYKILGFQSTIILFFFSKKFHIVFENSGSTRHS